MAELMMLNKDYSAGKSSLTRESQVLPLGKDYGKTKAGEKDSASLDFSNFLRASKEEGEKREEVRTDKEEKKPAVEDKKDEKTGKTKKTEEKKENNSKGKIEKKEDGTREEKIATVLTENSFLIERDQLKAELQTHPDLALTVAKVEDSAALKQLGETVDATAVLQKKEAGKTSGQKLNLSALPESKEQGEGKEGEEALLKPVAEGNAKEKVADALPKEEKVELHEKKTKEEKTSKVLEDRVARLDLKKEDTPVQGLKKVEPNFKEEGTKSVFKEELPMKLVTKEESIPKDVAAFLNEKMDLQKGEIKIELEPRSLGQITVKVNFSAGKANVVILAENAKTLHLLQNGAEDMARILEQKTGEQTKVVVHEEAKGEHLFRDDSSHGNENKDEAERRLREEAEKKKDSTEEFIHRMRLGLAE